LAFAGAALAAAQTAPRKEPAVYAGPGRAPQKVETAPGIRLALGRAPRFSLASLNQDERARLAQPAATLRLGIHRDVPAQALSAGAWASAAGGTRVWRLEIHSPGAEALRVEFRDFQVGDGKVWVHDGVSSAGPYSGGGPFGNGHFWSATTFAESVTLEYQPAAGAPDDALPFTIRTLAHRAPLSGAAASNPSTPDTAAYCELDPNCYADWKPAMSMVGQIVFEQDGSEYLCSGSAVATRDDSFKPYFLTAGHCIHTEDAARSIETYWTYQTSSCGGTPPASRGTAASVGGHLIGSGTLSQGDYSLVLLPSIPAGVTFEGWDTSDPPLGADLTGLHHPSGSWKRISFGNRVADSAADVEGQVAPANLYLQSLWAQGRTEPGSSGSPLFSSPGVVVGTLTYGPYSPDVSVCQIVPSVSGYGRFSNTYANLSQYFENLPAAEVMPAKTSLGFTVVNGSASGGQAVRLNAQSAGQIPFKLRADAAWIQVSPASGVVSQGAPATVQIVVDPSKFDQPDRYLGTVTILSGAAAPQFIDITADVHVEKSDIQVAISPNPVMISNGQWAFTIQLAETAGAPTQLTGLKINGVDYSSSVVNWFGSNHIDTNGSIQAPLTAAGPFAKGAQYFEFWGVDDSTAVPWYRSASIQFLQ
jgi:hypothetical protein